MKFFTYTLRLIATLALAGTAAVANGTIPAVWGPVFAGIAFACGLAHAQPVNVKAFLAKLFSKPGAAAVLFVALSLSLAGCHLFPPVTGPTPPTTDGGVSPDAGFGACLETTTHAAVLNILPDVVSALSTGAYEVELLALAVQATPGVVYCAVEAAVDELKKIKLQSADGGVDSVVAASIANGQAYLAVHAGK